MVSAQPLVATHRSTFSRGASADTTTPSHGQPWVDISSVNFGRTATRTFRAYLCTYQPRNEPKPNIFSTAFVLLSTAFPLSPRSSTRPPARQTPSIVGQLLLSFASNRDSLDLSLCLRFKLCISLRSSRSLEGVSGGFGSSLLVSPPPILQHGDPFPVGRRRATAFRASRIRLHYTGCLRRSSVSVQLRWVRLPSFSSG